MIVAAASGVATGDSIFAGSQARRPAARRSTPLSVADSVVISCGGSEIVGAGGTDLGALISGGTQFACGSPVAHSVWGLAGSSSRAAPRAARWWRGAARSRPTAPWAALLSTLASPWWWRPALKLFAAAEVRRLLGGREIGANQVLVDFN